MGTSAYAMAIKEVANEAKINVISDRRTRDHGRDKKFDQ